MAASPVVFTRLLGVRAVTAGATARRAGAQLSDCPYRTDKGRVEKALSYAWVQGYQRGRTT